MSDYIRTYTGKKFYPLDPNPDDVDIRDIAHALSLQTRFTGHTRRHLSVAEHSLFVSYITADVSNGLIGLLHDASEAYLVDVPTPVKHDPAFAFYREAEHKIQAAVCEHFNIDTADLPRVKRADRIALVLEAVFNMPPEFTAVDIADWERPDDWEWEAYKMFCLGLHPTNIEGDFLAEYFRIASHS